MKPQERQTMLKTELQARLRQYKKSKPDETLELALTVADVILNQGWDGNIDDPDTAEKEILADEIARMISSFEDQTGQILEHHDVEDHILLAKLAVKTCMEFGLAESGILAPAQQVH
jgi:hypothetical protein